MLPLPANVTFDVYRGFNTQNPYTPPNRPAALKGVSGRIRHHVRNGKFGYYPAWAQEPLYWTNVLEVEVGTDIRSKYSSQQVAPNEAGGDTIMVPDYPYPGTCTAFVAVMVQRRDRGTALDRLFVYLDRARPSYGNVCPDPSQGQNCCGITGTSNPTLHVTLQDAGGCAVVAGSYAITWNGSVWAAKVSVPNLLIELQCSGGQFLLLVACSTDEYYAFTAPATVQCSPLQVTWPLSTAGGGACCTGKITAVLTT